MFFHLSKKAKKFSLAALFWAVLVCIYSVIYWGLWQKHADSFIVNKEFNLNPIEVLQFRLWETDRTAVWSVIEPVRAPAAAELDSLMNAVAELDKTAVEVESALVPLQSRQAALAAESERVMRQHSEAMWQNVEKYRASAIDKEHKEVERQTNLVSALEEHIGANPSSYQAVVLAEARVNLAHAKYQETAKVAEAGQFVLKNLGMFANPKTSEELFRLRSELDVNEKQQQELLDKLMKVRQGAIKSLENWNANRRDRLKWIDFLYFSVGVSTSTTFGDIIPNSRFARVVALSQLVLCVFLLGYLVSLAGPNSTASQA